MIAERGKLAAYVTFVLLFAASASEAEAPANPLPDITPRDLATRIRAARAAHTKGRFTAEFQQQVDPGVGLPQPGRADADPGPIQWPGRLHYASDGRRWKLERDTATFVWGNRKTIPQRWVSGFDGIETYSWQRVSLTSYVTLGHDGSGSSIWTPSGLFWYQGDTLLHDLEQDVPSDVERTIAQRDVDGARCYVVSTRSTKHEYASEVSISPRQGYLPLRTIRSHQRRVHLTYNLSGVREAAPGVWVPERVVRESINRRGDGASRVSDRLEVVVTAYHPGEDVPDEALAFEPPYGADVMDYRLGYAYHNDPWWSEVGTLFRERFDWPQTDLSVLRRLRTPANPLLEGKPAPAFRDLRWVHGKPVDLARFQGRVVLVEFWDKYVCEEVAALRRLYETYKPAGLEMVAIHTPTKDVEAVRRFAREYSLAHPIAIDAEGEFPGATASAWGVQHQPCLFLMDAEGIVHTVGKAEEREGHLVETVVRLLQEAGARDVHPIALDGGRVTPEMDKAVRDMLKTVVPLAPTAAEIRGRVVDGQGRPIAGAQVQGTLSVTVLIGVTPGGYQIIGPAKSLSAFTDADGRFAIPNLCKGHYTLEARAPDRAWRTLHAIVTPELLPVDLEVVLDQGDAIAGRVVDESGHPVAGAALAPQRRHHEVNGADVTTSLIEPPPVRTDDQGRFRLSGLEHGRYEIDVAAPGFDKLAPDPVPAGSVDLKIVLKTKLAR